MILQIYESFDVVGDANDDEAASTREIDDDGRDLMLMLDITSESVEYMVVKTVYGQRSEVHLNRVGEFWLNGRIEDVRRR